MDQLQTQNQTQQKSDWSVQEQPWVLQAASQNDQLQNSNENIDSWAKLAEQEGQTWDFSQDQEQENKKDADLEQRLKLYEQQKQKQQLYEQEKERAKQKYLVNKNLDILEKQVEDLIINDQISIEQNQKKQTNISENNIKYMPQWDKNKDLLQDSNYKEVDFKKLYNWECLDCLTVNQVIKQRCKFCLWENQNRIQRMNIEKEQNLQNEFDLLLVTDLECNFSKSTCLKIQEIVEFPLFVIDIKQKQVIDKFYSFVKPTVCQLTKNTTNFTGVTQEDVDNAPEIQEVLNRIQDFLRPYTNKRMVMVNDCDSDYKFLKYECQYKKIEIPGFFSNYINLKQIFPLDLQKLPEKIDGKVLNYSENIKQKFSQPPTKFDQMLQFLNIENTGTGHCGYDDCQNICNVIIEILNRGYKFTRNQMQFQEKKQKDTNHEDSRKIRYLVITNIVNSFILHSKEKPEVLLLEARIYDQKREEFIEGQSFQQYIKPSNQKNLENLDEILKQKKINRKNLEENGLPAIKVVELFNNWVFKFLDQINFESISLVVFGNTVLNQFKAEQFKYLEQFNQFYQNKIQTNDDRQLSQDKKTQINYENCQILDNEKNLNFNKQNQILNKQIDNNEKIAEKNINSQNGEKQTETLKSQLNVKNQEQIIILQNNNNQEISTEQNQEKQQKEKLTIINQQNDQIGKMQKETKNMGFFQSLVKNVMQYEGKIFNEKQVQQLKIQKPLRKV